MQELILYSYSKYSTCRKALKWLARKGFEYKLTDFIQNSPTIKFLELALEQYFKINKEIFNTRVKTCKLFNFDIYSLSNQQFIKLLQTDGKLIKRAFLVYQEKNNIGF